MGAFQFVSTGTNITASPAMSTPLLAFKFHSVPASTGRNGDVQRYRVHPGREPAPFIRAPKADDFLRQVLAVVPVPAVGVAGFSRMDLRVLHPPALET